MPDQPRVEPGTFVGSTPSNSSDLPRGATSASKTAASIEASTIATLAAAAKAVEMTRAEALGMPGKLSTVSSRLKDGKATVPKADFQPSPATEKRRMSPVAPEPGKAAEQAKSDASKADVTKVETPRMPAQKVVVTPLGERAWEIKGLTPPKGAPDAKMTDKTTDKEQAKATPPKARNPKFDAARLVGTVISIAAFAGRGLGNLGKKAGPKDAAGGAGPRAETGIKPDIKSDLKGDAKVNAAPRTGAREKRRVSPIAAVVAIAAVTGAVGGALATSFMTRSAGAGDGAVTAADPDLQASVTRIDGDVQALKQNVDQIAKAGQSLMNDTGDRLDRLEKEQADTSARLLRLGEATTDRPPPPDRSIRATPQASSAMAAVPPPAPRDTTGSVTQPAAAVAPAQTRAAAPKAETGRLPIVEGWVLRDVGRGSAVIEGKHGFYEVYAGDPVPGLGKVDAIRKQDGRWVVVTTKGLVVQR